MEMKIIFEEENEMPDKKNMGDKPRDIPEDNFPINSTWKEEVKKLLLEANDLAGKGDGSLVQEVCSKIQEIIDIIDSDKESEDNEDVKGMEGSKKDYMDRFQEESSEDE